MKKFFRLLIIACCMLPFSFTSSLAEATNLSYDLSPFHDSEVSAPFFKNSYGYAFFPTVGKGGFGIGGAYGKGQVYRRGKLTGTTSLIKLTLGFQLGGQVFSEIIFFQDKRAYDRFTNGSFEFEASASAVAITAGVQATAGTSGASAGVSIGPQAGKQISGEYINGTAIFVHTKGGLMYEAAIGGQKFKFQPLTR